LNSGEAKAEISICEKKLSNIREIQTSNEVLHKEIKEKGIRLENMIQRLFARAALVEISLSQVQQARQELNELKGKLKQIAIVYSAAVAICLGWLALLSFCLALMLTLSI
jgi:biotin synthase-related radical SAM superfamily protein